MQQGDDNQRGFSLVELSIVLVILGLLVGGILTGQSLIRSAELKDITSDIQQFTAAIVQFKDEYGALPGDYANATDIWGTAASCPGTASTPSTSEATCDGNGNRMIQSDTTVSERFRSWQHLANAGLIAGNYAGVPGSAGLNHAVIGFNVPSAVGGEVGYTLTWTGGNASLYPSANDNHVIMVGGDVNSNNATVDRVFTPREVYSIDRKIDDGRPGLGTIMPIIVVSNCVTSNNPVTAEYSLENDSKDCAFLATNFLDAL